MLHFRHRVGTLLACCVNVLTLSLAIAQGEEGFTDLFDGRSLKGWRTADSSFWSVEDGAITGKITPEHPLKTNLYLIWEGGELADFQLKLKHRVFGSKNINCGFQFRSRELPNHDIAGYQVDNNLDTDWLVRLYDEHGRETLAWRGESVAFDNLGKATRAKLQEASGKAWFKLEEWHEYDLTCVGTKLTLKVDGRLAAEVVDDDPKQQDLYGILGLQLHTGPPTIAQFKDIRLKVLKPVSAVQKRSALPLEDKTLVVWAAPANLEQRGGSALTLDDGQSHFDGVVFGELSPKKWMAGSDFFRRTTREQNAWPEEQAAPDTFVKVAVVYRGEEVSIYREGTLIATYKMDNPPQSFGTRAHVVFGRRHLDVTEPRNSFAGRIKDARIYDRALSGDEIQGLVAGQSSPNLPPWAWWSFPDEGLREKTGRFNQVNLLGDVRIQDGCLALAGNGATVIATAENDDSSGVPIPKSWSADSAVPEEVLKSSRLLRERFLSDPYRPTYHFCVPEDMGMPGDPNGAFYTAGRYHLMYLYNRTGKGFCWGHISSTDLLHWRHHPDAVGPGDGDEGCFSGGAFVDQDGAAYLSYWMLWGSKGIGLAASKGPDYSTWTKFQNNPVIRSTEWGITEMKGSSGGPIYVGSADPSNIWKKNGRYYMLTGNLLVLNKIGRGTNAPPQEQGDRLYLFASDDLKRWDYLHVFYQRKPEWTDPSEDNMCPSFLPLPRNARGGSSSGKHLLLFISHNKGCQYYVGDYRDDHFYPGAHGRMTWVDNTYFAPEALLDGRGRQIMWAWLTDNPAGEKERGWSGVYSLPRTLWLGEDNTLRLAPVQELAMLRTNEKTWRRTQMGEGDTMVLKGLDGLACELQATARVDAKSRFGFKVRATPDGREQTIIYYDGETGELVFDATRSGSDGRKVVERAPLKIHKGEPLKLRLFIDKSVVEVFANDRQAICRRVYPGAEATGIELINLRGKARVESVNGWNISATNPY